MHFLSLDITDGVHRVKSVRGGMCVRLTNGQHFYIVLIPAALFLPCTQTLSSPLPRGLLPSPGVYSPPPGSTPLPRGLLPSPGVYSPPPGSTPPPPPRQFCGCADFKRRFLTETSLIKDLVFTMFCELNKVDIIGRFFIDRESC